MNHFASDMTTARAFGGDPALRTAVITRLTQAFVSSHLTPVTIHEWHADSGRGNLTGLCARSPTVAGYEAALGWPHAVGLTHELILRATQRLVPDPTAAEEEGAEPLVSLDPALSGPALAWLQAIGPGTDLSPMLLHFQRRLADLLMHGAPLLGTPSPEIRALLQAWRHLLSFEPRDDSASQAWADLRGKAGSAARQGPQAARIVAELVEAAAWPYRDAAVDWPAAWEAFLRDATRLDLDQVLDAPTGAILRAADAAWAEIERQAVLNPGTEVFEQAGDHPDLDALDDPAVQERLQDAMQVHARPLVLALLEQFTASATDCVAAAPSGAVAPKPGPNRDEVDRSAAGAVAEVVGPDRFETEVLRAKVPVLVDFWAPWCAPCVQFMPSFQLLADQYAARVKFVKVNIDENEELATALNIRTLPTVLLYEGGQAVERVTALNRSRICAVLDSRLAPSPPDQAPRHG